MLCYAVPCCATVLLHIYACSALHHVLVPQGMRRGSHPRRSKQQYELVSSTDLDAFADAEAE
eukprot:COSAG02_NODE_41315_length_396_cov_0.488215_1_plen_61_part_10